MKTCGQRLTRAGLSHRLRLYRGRGTVLSADRRDSRLDLEDRRFNIIIWQEDRKDNCLDLEDRRFNNIIGPDDRKEQLFRP